VRCTAGSGRIDSLALALALVLALAPLKPLAQHRYPVMSAQLMPIAPSVVYF
jgi:hypothetical protein